MQGIVDPTGNLKLHYNKILHWTATNLLITVFQKTLNSESCREAFIQPCTTTTTTTSDYIQPITQLAADILKNQQAGIQATENVNKRRKKKNQLHQVSLIYPEPLQKALVVRFRYGYQLHPT